MDRSRLVFTMVKLPGATVNGDISFAAANTPANSSLKLTVRLRFSRRPSRLRHLEFARRRATCRGIIGCAASGAPLEAGRCPAARNLTSGRWADDDEPSE